MDRAAFEPLSIEDAAARLKTDLETGLSDAAAQRRLERYGPNAIPETRVNPWLRFLSYFWGPIPAMIEIAALLSALVRHWEDFAIILAMLLINAGVGFWEEHKADNAIAALKKTLALKARVLRAGRWRTVPAAELVPGDVVRLRLGDIVPADVKLARGDYLSVDQSALTGESLPVDKKPGDIAFASSTVKMGEMTAIVTATGGDTYFGRTARLVESAGTVSHFQKAVLRIGNFLILTTLALVAVIVAVALVRRDPLIDTILFALILTVAAIPVALPAVLSVTMAVGAVRLARMKAIVSRLTAIEEMAGMDVLCTDKTGTLTRNALAVGAAEAIGAADADELLLAAALASRAEQADDPIDAAILGALENAAERLRPYRVVAFEPFDPVRKRAEAEIEAPGARFRVAKGAPQVILDLAAPDPETRRRVESRVEALAERGFRTLGVARRDDGGAWRFLGLVPLFDPPRADSAATVARAKALGLDIKMVTGDHVAIARETARALDLGTDIVSAAEALTGARGGPPDEIVERADGFAEVFPEHKFGIVKALQARGHIVGMTGDGVNDAPALKQADIGIAVSGATDAARSAAALVLTGTGLSVITGAIEEARKIFERMTSYAVFRIAETIRVLLFMTLSILAFNFYPVTPVMIVLLAILNDFPIMMIAYDNAPVAERPVRWNMRHVLGLSLALGVMGVISSFGLFWIAETRFAIPRETIQTLIFLKLLVAGHLTIFLTRNKGAVWDRPWPSWLLVAATETTQAIGTLAAVYGWFVAPIGWSYALAVWGYALAWFLVNSGVKIAVVRAMEKRARSSAETNGG